MSSESVQDEFWPQVCVSERAWEWMMALGTVATRVLKTALTYCFVSSLSCSSHWSYAVLSTSCAAAQSQ